MPWLALGTMHPAQLQADRSIPIRVAGTQTAGPQGGKRESPLHAHAFSSEPRKPTAFRTTQTEPTNTLTPSGFGRIGCASANRGETRTLRQLQAFAIDTAPAH